jgi:hypothetical protein
MTDAWDDEHPVTDEEKHAYCRRRTSCCATYIPPRMYDQAERLGVDMRIYVKTRPIPLSDRIHNGKR